MYNEINADVKNLFTKFTFAKKEKMRKEVRKMKTKKLLSVLMAVMMLFGCLSVSASALEINLPDELGAGVAKFRGLSEIASVEIPVAAEYT